MKIYFEDGKLMRQKLIPTQIDFNVSADDGVTRNRETLNWIRENRPNSTVYTNSIIAFNNVYAWNDELKVPEVYIRTGSNGEFTRIDNLTAKELRCAHNLTKLYIAGEFNT